MFLVIRADAVELWRLILVYWDGHDLLVHLKGKRRVADPNTKPSAIHMQNGIAYMDVLYRSFYLATVSFSRMLHSRPVMRSESLDLKKRRR